jgi:hypothetical protein
MKTIFYLTLLLIIISCSTEQKITNNYSEIADLLPKDYSDQLASIGEDYIHQAGITEIPLGKKSQIYLEQIFDRIVSNNEIFFENNIKPQFHIIKDKSFFVFSLPGARFYFSSGIFQKYLKSEELFAAVLALEVTKSKRNVYEKKPTIPLGVCSTEKMILLTRVSPTIRHQLNEWSYLVLKRSGFDPSVTLNWIQVQNRNILDFALLHGDTSSISREEHLFKNFMAKEGVSAVERKTIEANSSKDFYQLLNYIAGIE